MIMMTNYGLEILFWVILGTFVIYSIEEKKVKLTQELIDQIQEAMLHTNLKGEINWKDGDEVVVQLAGTFAKDKIHRYQEQN